MSARPITLIVFALLGLGIAVVVGFLILAERSSRHMARSAFAAETFAEECHLAIDRRKLATYERRPGFEFDEVISQLRGSPPQEACRSAKRLAEESGILAVSGTTAQGSRPVSRDSVIPRP